MLTLTYIAPLCLAKPTVRRHPQERWCVNLRSFWLIVLEILSFLYTPLCFSESCQCQLHQCQCLPHLSFAKPLSICHSPHMTGMQLTRFESFDCSSASLILGSGFARSRLRNIWTICSASWARKVMQLWTAGSHWMKATNEIQRNSLITSKAP